ncbi:MAG: MBL fold metallo-hydrolase [Rhodospirillaceae bacterium]|nr:MBL fold metallo-hydrolase [Rhodospirillaceae bacterium]MBT5241347.1 MBL fold metallo-hydrolase [Rhodospirillaceae bacterium]MBT6089610.1 MBL fold metallo-hydrolase [Rhodospirillaceae bacterium]MBT6960894.1 MBL fold metallo-hydrolase [Rhodospirillaceae bacterium]
MTLAVKFWGVRGSIACPSPQHVVYGGNTSCLEVFAGDKRIILDAGTGIRQLGFEFIRDSVKEGFILLTHSHWDHINGFPFFGPTFMPNSHFSIHAGHLSDHGGIENVLANQMANPTFPVPLEALQAELDFVDFHAGENWELYPGINLITKPLNHPNGATGYRIEHDGKSICYVTDTEHIIGKPDETVLALIEGADLVIYDSTYTDEEFPEKIGWGHSTWEEGIRLCKVAGVKQLAIFHHDPDHNDDFMRDIEHKAREMWDGALVAREHMILTPGQ